MEITHVKLTTSRMLTIISLLPTCGIAKTDPDKAEKFLAWIEENKLTNDYAAFYSTMNQTQKSKLSKFLKGE